MTGAPPLHDLAWLGRLLRQQEDEIAAAWGEAFERSTLRMPGRGTREAVAPWLASLLDGLALALEGIGAAPDAPAPGAPALRELEKNASFAGAAMAAGRVSGFDVAALVLALREALLPRVAADHHAWLRGLFEWLAVLTLDAFAGAGAMAAHEQVRAQLEQGTPVVLVAPRVPSVLLVGAPDLSTLEVILGRVVVLVVTQDAQAVIIDATGLADPGALAVLEGLGRFAGHDKISGAVELLVVGLADEHAAAWNRAVRAAGATMRREERFRDAVATALARAGWALVPRSSS